MGSALPSRPAKLVIAFIFKHQAILEKSRVILQRHFGKIDFTSQTLPFNYTDYYRKEMGDGLMRAFISFSRLINPEDLARIKTLTNRIEARFSNKGCRRVNLDPGYLDLAKLVLASTKDFSHRIYLRSGIYAEITLTYQDKSFRPNPWTYPDYRTPEYINIFNQIRSIYAQQIKTN